MRGGKRDQSGKRPRDEDDFEFDDGEDEELSSRDRALPSECLDSCVKLFVTHCEPNYSLPWTMRHQTSSTSSGFIIDGKRILTNAHCVEDYTVVKVKKRGGADKFVAEVLAIGRDCDLALLTISDASFWKGTRPIKLAPSLPSLQDVCTVVGFPIGGDNQCITQGVVSRIDMQEYVHGCCELLAVQIDAAINPGNSGGPAFGESHQCIGVAFQSLKDGTSENIGYIIPTQVVSHFLADVQRNKRYTGFCELGVDLQRCENPSLRVMAKMGSKATGLMVKRVLPLLSDVLCRGDIITHFDGTPIANDGTVAFGGGGERIYLSYLISQKFVGENAELRVLRNGRAIAPISIELNGSKLLVPVHSSRSKSGCHDLRVPQYLVVGGLVFVPACEPYLRSEFGDDFDAKAPITLLERWQYGTRQAGDEQVVVLSQVLAHTSNVGYEHLNNMIVAKLNDQPVRNLKGLLEAVQSNKETFLRLHLSPHDELVVLEASKVKAATAEVLRQHNIASDRSDDL
mmetsp:Transcript_8529/g.21862  ORF Transcript_8529/g.21862 Transcript_8529/m.21862 type:complete len:513 (+) Transcript_8529:51-1589(+)